MTLTSDKFDILWSQYFLVCVLLLSNSQDEAHTLQPMIGNTEFAVKFPEI